MAWTLPAPWNNLGIKFQNKMKEEINEENEEMEFSSFERQKDHL